MKRHGAQNLLLLIGLGLPACANSGGSLATPAPTQLLVPYQTATILPTGTIAEATAAEPTATPQVYVIVEGDTLFAIAARFTITVDVLRAANPGVDPLLLSPGIELVIPGDGATPIAAIPSPTPVLASLGIVECYASALGELWCFLLVENDNEELLENVIGKVDLLSAEDEVLASLEAIPPLNVLLPGAAMPLVAYSGDPPRDWVSTRGQLLSAYSLATENEIYLDVILQAVDIEITDSGSSARVQGLAQVIGEQAAEVLWVLAVAYDADGNVAGVRRWESTGEKEFDFVVYSLGPEILRVELLAEARP